MSACACFYDNTHRGQRKIRGSQFYPSIKWNPKGIVKLGSSDLAESTLNCWEILLVPRWSPSVFLCLLCMSVYFCLSICYLLFMFSFLVVWIICKSFFENYMRVYNTSLLYLLWLSVTTHHSPHFMVFLLYLTESNWCCLYEHSSDAIHRGMGQLSVATFKVISEFRNLISSTSFNTFS